MGKGEGTRKRVLVTAGKNNGRTLDTWFTKKATDTGPGDEDEVLIINEVEGSKDVVVVDDADTKDPPLVQVEVKDIVDNSGELKTKTEVPPFSPDTSECPSTSALETSDSSDNDDSVVEVSQGDDVPPPPTEDGEYEVEAIVDYVGGEFQVKWKGYDSTENTWEPLEHLVDGCKKKLVDFYLKRKRDAIEGDDGPENMKKKLKALPPDPRRTEEVIQAFYDENGYDPSPNEEKVVCKMLTKGLKGANSWTESKLRKLIADSEFTKPGPSQLQILYEKSLPYFVSARKQHVYGELKKWEKDMNSITRGMPKIIVQNQVDLTGAPADFTYINDYKPAEGITIPNDPPWYCTTCEGTTCSESCFNMHSENKKKTCYYDANGRIKVPVGTPIYECNKACKCSAECPNRVVQDGVTALKDLQLCIFRTDNRGWGVKTIKKIKKGSFVCLYVGEIIRTEEADRRGKTYDAEGCTYLFDLDFNETDEAGEDCPYTVDAKKFGNISHFINHSCDPNLDVYGVWSDCLDVNLPKLALFAARAIEKDEELSFDYKRGSGEAESAMDSPRSINQIDCLCGAANCRKVMFSTAPSNSPLN